MFAHIMMISPRTSNWNYISSRKSSIIFQGWQSQPILSGIHSLLSPFWRILELKVTLWKDQMSIFFSIIKQRSLEGEVCQWKIYGALPAHIRWAIHGFQDQFISRNSGQNMSDGQVFGQKVKPLVTRSDNIFPIWDYYSGLYWTGYLTTDVYDKKNYKDMGRLLRVVHKINLAIYISDPPQSPRSKAHYQKLEEFAQQVSYFQHYNGISGTSKYKVMDQLEVKNDELSHMSTQRYKRCLLGLVSISSICYDFFMRIGLRERVRSLFLIQLNLLFI